MIEWLIIPLVVVLDQLSKYLVVMLGYPVVYNQGGAFGLLGSSLWFSSLTYGILIVLILGWFKKRKSTGFKERLIFLTFVGGGISNGIDRLRLGAVVDFIDIKIWPVFNLADVFISTALCLLIWLNLKKLKVHV